LAVLQNVTVPKISQGCATGERYRRQGGETNRTYLLIRRGNTLFNRINSCDLLEEYRTFRIKILNFGSDPSILKAFF
jgi:hypothetical protein